MIVWVAFIIPFTLFFYEADSEKSIFAGLIEAGQYWFVFIVAFAIILGVSYAIEGYVIFNMQTLQSGFTRVSVSATTLSGCVPAGSWLATAGSTMCDSPNGHPGAFVWKTRCTFPIYVIALVTVVGWLLFMVFAGVGLIALPVDLVRSYLARPQTMITKTEYVRLAGEIGKKAKTLLDALRAAQADVRRNGRTRKSRRVISALSGELVQLEDEEMKLREVYPQSEDAELSWAVTVIGYFLNFLGGVLAAALSGAWLIHILIYMFLDPPPSPVLNTMFIKMDETFGLFGTTAFAVFCFYLVLVTLKGNFKLGLNLVFFTVHPMSPGNTLMSSFLFNTGLIMLCSISIIQFCATAFDEYANETSVSEIFGNQITNLKGIGYVFQANIFVFALFAIAGLTGMFLPFMRKAKYKPKANFDSTFDEKGQF